MQAHYGKLTDWVMLGWAQSIETEFASEVIVRDESSHLTALKTEIGSGKFRQVIFR